jgi:hypothetical protein
MDFFYLRSWARSLFYREAKPTKPPAIETNIRDPKQFLESFDSMIEGFRKVFDAAKEQDSYLIRDGKEIASDGDYKSGFHCSNQLNRPHEFLQSILDMARVQYEPAFIGTYFLNANIGFIHESMPDHPFTLGYFSVTSELRKFSKAWTKDVLPHLSETGYDLGKLETGFVVVTVARKNFTQELISETNNTLGAGFSAQDVLGMTVRGMAGDNSPAQKQFYAGQCIDDGLDEKMRISGWLILSPAAS